MTVMEVGVLAVVMMEVVAPNGNTGHSVEFHSFHTTNSKRDVNDLHAIVYINLGLATAS